MPIGVKLRILRYELVGFARVAPPGDSACPQFWGKEKSVISSSVHKNEHSRLQNMQNVQFLDILPRIGVGVSAPGAQLAQDSQTGVSQICLT